MQQHYSRQNGGGLVGLHSPNVFRDVSEALPTYACLLTYLLHGVRVLLEKLTGFQLVKKFPAFHGTRRFITTFTSARHLSLSSVSSIQSIPPLPEDSSEYYSPI